MVSWGRPQREATNETENMCCWGSADVRSKDTGFFTLVPTPTSIVRPDLPDVKGILVFRVTECIVTVGGAPRAGEGPSRAGYSGSRGDHRTKMERPAGGFG